MYTGDFLTKRVLTIGNFKLVLVIPSVVLVL